MKTALIGIDYIIDIMHPEGKIARSAVQAEERKVIDKANQLLELATQKGWLKILINVGFSKNYTEQPKDSPMFGKVKQFNVLKLGEKGTDFHPDLNAKLADIVITKPRVSAFYCTMLESILRANKIEHLIIAGVSTIMTIQSTAREAHDRDYQITIVEDACASATQFEHDSSIEFLKNIATIVKTKELVSK